MQLVMLSGNSLHNQDWVYEARDEVSDLFDSTYVQNYRYWQTNEEWIDLPHELSVLKDQHLAGDYGVFAKSIGTVLAVQALDKNIISPKFLLLLGLPLGYITKNYPQFASILTSNSLPVTVIHNTEDVVGTAEAAREYLLSCLNEADFTFIETPGDTHDYEDYVLIRSELKRLAT